jgi:hypothetical protein
MEYSEDSLQQDWSIGPKKIVCTGNFTKDFEAMKQRDLELLKERRKKMNHIYGSERKS